MKKRNQRCTVLSILASLALPLSWADASVILQFNGNPNNIVGGSPETIQAAPGGTIVISLQLVSTGEQTTGFDYWLSQFSGPGSGVFSITDRDFTGSDYDRPHWANSVATTPTDNWHNTQATVFGTPDGIPDNLLSPQNGPSLGARFTDFPNNAGTFQVATFTLTISLGAAPGIYQIRTFDYPGFGWTDEAGGDYPFTAHAAINIQVVPEPGTWLLLGLGLAGLVLSRLTKRKD